MPRVGERQKITLGIAQASTHTLSALFATAQAPSYVHLYASFHFDLINIAALMLLDDSEEVFIMASLALVCTFNNFITAGSNLEASIMSQQAIHQHTFKIALAIRQAFDELTHLRYIRPRIHDRLTAFQVLKFQNVFNGSDRNFLRHARMSRQNFERLADLIRYDLVFVNNSSLPQTPVDWQLLITLCRLGSSGNGGSAYMIGCHFGFSEGSVHNFTHRCFEAILKLEKDYVNWPNQEQRNEIKSQIGRKSFFQDCVGFIDGTLIPLAFAPSKDPEDFWTRKHTYALNTMLVSDHRGRIIYYLHGWCGSSHDQRVYASSQLAQRPENFFSDNEYILADSGYTCSQHLIPTFKSPRLQTLDVVRREFNRALSEQRVVSEHSNGQLKLRFQSLQSLRITIKDVSLAKHAVRWIKVCCILHNFTIHFRDQWMQENHQDKAVLPLENEPLDLQPNEERNASYRRRNELLQQFRNYRARQNT